MHQVINDQGVTEAGRAETGRGLDSNHKREKISTIDLGNPTAFFLPVTAQCGLDTNHTRAVMRRR